MSEMGESGFNYETRPATTGLGSFEDFLRSTDSTLIPDASEAALEALIDHQGMKEAAHWLRNHDNAEDLENRIEPLVHYEGRAARIAAKLEISGNPHGAAQIIQRYIDSASPVEVSYETGIGLTTGSMESDYYDSPEERAIHQAARREEILDIARVLVKFNFPAEEEEEIRFNLDRLITRFAGVPADRCDEVFELAKDLVRQEMDGDGY